MRRALTASIIAGALIAMAGPAAAKCTRLGFSVNDYGKDGPTKDAKELLDKHIAKWAAEHKIAKYTVGKKDVKCDLFLNLIVVDEHTCRAEASVCWTEAPGQKPFKPEVATGAAPAPAKPAAKAAKKAAAPAAKATPTETGAIAPAAPAAVPAASPAAKEETAAPAAKPAAAAAPPAAAAAPPAAPATPSVTLPAAVPQQPKQ